jgi:hypothetical protein
VTLFQAAEQPVDRYVDIKGAVTSTCGLYRYRLYRQWDRDLPTVAFCMLNPSTADAAENDPTIRRCIRFAQAWGYGRLEVYNLFALRSTDPRKLYDHDDPCGPGNVEEIEEAATGVHRIVCAWGRHGRLLDAGQAMTRTLCRVAAASVFALKINSDGSPAHPLYVRGDVVPVPYG